ncbi:hypothetical protein COCC4DRAFT_60395 [Bipolaris maydis ATCC 48331]|uniref:J domain-containing protein n=2 Tax=Cochliobolus heterostrophus TaxID=5016 RepID=M2ULW3_COCH5|nr:uncharacterized protein COCC4DRAFT_60395 [Bipolaris maydis ATCC 48331]EMD88938.1 hypothetical protein COCHEDRAFT_1216802 [Bipolaris maydis C5]KAJ5028501.1 hypothetical protein J3E73DRAFT_367419 [Bipolaris maydis]ENI05346.1 hypothetical protein COCC4DRAFT_60395 [Bipolaris maydis ATCC 48331]KAJ5063275.1 hypothetical protein J3E74DRAFT_287577 [Bipolaris maydis]KAJ6199543.1 hypothetical protein J3E72DRAFT_186821 [Bipolaris maydis]
MSPSPLPSDQVCKSSFSPFRSPSPRKRFAHERNQSEAVQRPRPMSISSNSPAVQHTKRASIYVSDASVILAQRTPMASPISSPDSMYDPALESPDAVDHYAILEITPKATTDDVKAAYRRLRVVYFSSDAKKYRALQAAFDTLMNPETREVYDANYQPRPAAPTSLASIGEILDPGKHWRQDSAHGDDPAIPEEEEEEEEQLQQLQEEPEEPQQVRNDDPNWGLKHYNPRYEPVLGSEPYMSYIPLPTNLLLFCRGPTYVGNFAFNARPN